MPSPMIYQDLTTAALLGHAAQYHSETEIVSVSTGGEKERSCWGEVASRAQRLASALASLGLPPGARCATLAWNNRRHLEIYFAVASGGWVTHTVNPRLSVDHLRYILNDAADEVLFFDQTFFAAGSAAAAAAADGETRRADGVPQRSGAQPAALIAVL